jgi:hypothetical protein
LALRGHEEREVERVGVWCVVMRPERGRDAAVGACMTGGRQCCLGQKEREVERGLGYAKHGVTPSLVQG